MILYPTETLYALGVNALDEAELKNLYELKGRSSEKVASWLVRIPEDILLFAKVPPKAEKIIARYLPGSLTIVLETLSSVPRSAVAPDGTIGFRITTDETAQKLIEDFMAEHSAPLTCTSANVSGSPTFSTPGEILQQFGPNAQMIDRVLDDGPRKGLASTVVRVIGDEVKVLREGEISESAIREVIHSQ